MIGNLKAFMKVFVPKLLNMYFLKLPNKAIAIEVSIKSDLLFSFIIPYSI